MADSTASAENIKKPLPSPPLPSNPPAQAAETTVVLRRDKATNFNGGTRSPIEEVAVVVRRSLDATPVISKLFQDKRANGDGIVTTTLQKVSPPTPPSCDGRGKINQLWNRTASFERDMDANLIKDRSPYDSVESEIGITTNRAYQDDCDYAMNEGKTPPTPSTLKAAGGSSSAGAATIDMPMMSGSPSDDFLYALEHML